MRRLTKEQRIGLARVMAIGVALYATGAFLIVAAVY